MKLPKLAGRGMRLSFRISSVTSGGSVHAPCAGSRWEKEQELTRGLLRYEHHGAICVLSKIALQDPWGSQQRVYREIALAAR